MITTENYLSVSKARTEGYLKALTDNGIAVKEEIILKMPSMSMDEDRFKRFFDVSDIDAVLCVNEIFAITGMRLVKEKGLKIPNDISFIGFTDGLLSKYANPSLTAIAQHGEKMGEIAADLLIQKIESENEEETYITKILEPTLIERDSTIS